MSDNIFNFPNLLNYEEIEPDVILEENIGRLKTITLIGTTIDGDEILCTSETQTAEIIYAIERMKMGLLISD